MTKQQHGPVYLIRGTVLLILAALVTTGVVYLDRHHGPSGFDWPVLACASIGAIVILAIAALINYAYAVRKFVKG